MIAAIVALGFATASGDVALATPHKHHQAIAPTTRDADTTTTSTIPPAPPQPKPQVPDPTAKDDDVLPPPFHLPTASRQRMRDCGLKWQTMKASGEAGEQIWRDFATRCLAASGGPFDTRVER